MQEQCDLLAVGADILRAAHDQRGGQQVHFVLGDMGMHPVRAGTRAKIIGAAFAGLQHRHRQVGNAVRCVGRDLAVPVDEGRCIESIRQVHGEGLSGVQHKAGSTIGVQKPPDGCRLAAHVDGPGGGGQGQAGGLGADLRGNQKSCGRSRRGGHKAATGQERHAKSPGRA